MKSPGLISTWGSRSNITSCFRLCTLSFKDWSLALVSPGSCTLLARPAAGFSVSMRQQYVGRLSGGAEWHEVFSPNGLLIHEYKLLCAGCCMQVLSSHIYPAAILFLKSFAFFFKICVCVCPKESYCFEFGLQWVTDTLQGRRMSNYLILTILGRDCAHLSYPWLLL